MTAAAAPCGVALRRLICKTPEDALSMGISVKSALPRERLYHVTRRLHQLDQHAFAADR